MGTVRKQFSEFCPETESAQTIEIAFKEVLRAGDPTVWYVAANYSCGHRSGFGCKFCEADTKDCPVLQAGERKMNQGNTR